MTGPLDILIVEDEPMLAFQLEDEIIDSGHRVVGSAPSAAEALARAAETHPSLILMDLHLADGETGLEAARTLAGNAACVLLVTASGRSLPEDFGGAVGVIDKPWSPSGIRAALSFMSKALSGGVPPPPPGSLRLAPRCRPGGDGLYCFA
jgi:CheY-like chemotaxis protein